jgi:two-component system sensor histidine kinase RegB
VGQAIAVAAVSKLLHASIPVGPLAASVGVLALSNCALALRARRGADMGARTLGAILLFDSVQLTTQLALSGGPSNPFAVLYLVEILIAVLVLRARWIAAVALTSLAGFSATFLASQPVGGLSPTAERAGLWIALAVAVGITAYLGGQLAATLREHAAALARSQRLAGRAEKLASLSSLAAGAAHELGTPLGTIAIASAELERPAGEPRRRGRRRQGRGRPERHPFRRVRLRMPWRSGLDVVRAIRALRPDAVIVVLTGYGSIATAVDAVRLGATHYLTKPADASDLLAAFARGTQGAAAPADFEVPSLARAEWEHIHRVLSDCNGNISQAARALRIQRRSLQRKLAKYPVPK